MKKRRFFKNALTLSVTSILLQLVGMAFNAYMVRQIGPTGMGLFSLIMSVYVVFIMLACAGFGTAATRLAAEGLSNDGGAVRSAVVKPLWYSALTGSAACLLMLLFAQTLAGSWLGDAQAETALCILAFALPFVAVSSVFKGYFTAVRRVYWGAIADVAELIARIALIVYLLPAQPTNSQAYMAFALGITLSNAFGLALLAAAYLLDRRKHTPPESAKPTRAAQILHISAPVALSSCLRSGLMSASKLLVPTSLQRYGMTPDAALGEYGTIHAMVFPILQLPEMILLSFATLLVPEFAELTERNDPRNLQRAVRTVLRATFLLSIGVIGVLSCFAGEFTQLIYSNASAGKYLAVLAPLAMFLYLDKVVDAVLTGLKQQVHSMLYNLFESGLTVGLIMLLVPRYGMGGYLIVLFAGKAVNMALSLARLLRVSGLEIRFIDWVLRPVGAMLLSIAITLLLGRFRALSALPLAACLLGLYAAQLWAIRAAE